MKQLLLGVSLLMLMGCSEKWIYQPAPPQTEKWEQASYLQGTVTPWDLTFTAVSHFEQDQVRLIVLSELGVKLLDVQVTPTTAIVHAKPEAFPKVAAGAFVRLARAELFTTCPSASIHYQDARTRALFEITLQGAQTCL